MGKGGIRMIDGTSQNIRFQIRGKETEEFETQFRVREVFPLPYGRAQVRKFFREIQPSVRCQALCYGLRKAYGIGLTASACEMHFSDSKDATNLGRITCPSQMPDEQPGLRHRQIPD